jgi:hypothetical protein
MSGSTQDEWVSRVLGIDVAGLRAQARHNDGGMMYAPATQGGSARIEGLVIWQRAKAAIDARLDRFAQRLRASGHPMLQRVADEGLPTLGKQHEVALEDALRAHEQAPPEQQQKTAASVRAGVQAYRAALAKEPAFRLIDENPFRIEVALRETLGQALMQIEQGLPTRDGTSALPPAEA